MLIDILSYTFAGLLLITLIALIWPYGCTLPIYVYERCKYKIGDTLYFMNGRISSGEVCKIKIDAYEINYTIECYDDRREGSSSYTYGEDSLFKTKEEVAQNLINNAK